MAVHQAQRPQGGHVGVVQLVPGEGLGVGLAEDQGDGAQGGPLRGLRALGEAGQVDRRWGGASGAQGQGRRARGAGDTSENMYSRSCRVLMRSRRVDIAGSREYDGPH